jgi:hypothetical protein
MIGRERKRKSMHETTNTYYSMFKIQYLMSLLGERKLCFSNVRDGEYFRYVFDIDSS